MTTDQIIDGMMATLDGAFGEGAAMMTDELFRMLGEQAELVPGSDPLRAKYPATPGAVPRRVSGWMQSHVGFDRVGQAEWLFGIRRGVPYSHPLEYGIGHPFFSVLIDQNFGALQALVSQRMTAGGY